MARDKRQYKVCAAYDTETCNIGEGADSRAYVVCYQVNDLRAVRLDKYEPGRSDHIRVMRLESEMLAFVDDLISWGKHNQKIPIIAAYNLMFDLKSLMYDLRLKYDMAVNAQTTTSVYTLDLLDDGGNVMLRFWDTFYLEQHGLHAMGEVAGLPKDDGWDYARKRTPMTPLTAEETYYASRDVQVIPAYLRYLLDANAWLKPDMLGSRVLTKTSLVRQMAQMQFVKLKIPNSKDKGLTVQKAFMSTCKENLPYDFWSYALRKACFRGGLTFTSARYACVVMRNVMSLDVTSMHHTFMSSRVPVGFVKTGKEVLQVLCEKTVRLTREQVLSDYCMPFDYGLHVRVRFKGVRLKAETCFATWGVATLARGKFQMIVEDVDRWYKTETAQVQENANRARGWHDMALRPHFAFGKLYEAEEAIVYVTEIELWCMSRVYAWDEMEVIEGEATYRFALSPDYVTLQSNELFEMKSIMKRIVNTYHEGEPYAQEIPDLVPKGIAQELRAGTISSDFLQAYYGNTIKGMFNGIYGTQAQDIYKPGFIVGHDGLLHVDSASVCTEDNFAAKQPKHPKVLYTYGMRIVGRSRMHLIIAMELLHEGLGDHIRVTGGDTDSIKMSVDEDVSDEEVLRVLKPLHDAADQTIARGYERIRRNFPNLASALTDVGHFDVEWCGPTKRYGYHMELWNKARMSIDAAGEPHVTCAGLSRPEGAYTIIDYMRGLLSRMSPDEALRHALGYNVYVDNSVSHAIERTDCANDAIVDCDVRDWQGNVAHVHAHEVYALYDTGRLLGEMTKATNIENVEYMEREYGRKIDTEFKVIAHV